MIQRGEIKDRLDATFFASSTWLDLSKYPLARIDTYFAIKDGDHSRLPSEEVTTAEKGVRYLRAQDLVEGEIISEDPIYVSYKYFSNIPRTHIRSGDFLFSIMASIGNSAIVPDNFPPATANRAVGILSPRTDARDLTKYLFYLFSTDLGMQLFTRIKKGGLQQRTNLSDIADLEFPLPPKDKREKLISVMDEARSRQRQKLARADELLYSFDDYLLTTLGLDRPIENNRNCFAVSFSKVNGRFDPYFYSPRFENILRMLSKINAVKLGKLVLFSDETWRAEKSLSSNFRYIEISDVNPKTGEAKWEEIPVKEAPSRARMVVKADDIIVSLTRPHHGSIAHLSERFDGCIASTGFAVIRQVSPQITKEYLWCILRGQFSLQQMLQRSSGGNYPAIIKSELAKIVIPVPDRSIQRSIVSEINHRREEARRLRIEAETEWQKAKQWFEEQLLGSEAL